MRKNRRRYFFSFIIGIVYTVPIKYANQITFFVPSLREISAHQYERIAQKYGARGAKKSQYKSIGS